MSAPISRRSVLSSALAVAALHVTQAKANPAPSDLEARLAEIEASAKGRLGVAILDTKTGTMFGRREFERFPLNSTFKLLAAALVLERVDNGQEQLDRRVVFSDGDIVDYSPVTKDHAGPPGMTVAEICEAAITRSDNTAGNLMLASFGGPAALTQWLRTLGDKATRLDRTEPDLNEAKPGDPRDGTTPRSMAYTLQRILLGNVLSNPSEKRLIDWLAANTTGDARLRAGLPADWRVGDKTGNGATSDVAIAWPPGGHPPVIITAYLVDTQASLDVRNAAIADVGRAAAALL
jgi:beta-lactamase class A